MFTEIDTYFSLFLPKNCIFHNNSDFGHKTIYVYKMYYKISNYDTDTQNGSHM